MKRRTPRCDQRIAPPRAPSSEPVCVQPAVATIPPRASTETTMRSPCSASAASSSSPSANAAVPSTTRPTPAANAAAIAAASAGRRRAGSASPVSAAIASHVREVDRHAGAGAVEVDDVQALRAGGGPAPRGVERVVAYCVALVEVALRQAHGAAVEDVDRRVEDHAAARSRDEVREQRAARRARTSRGGTGRRGTSRARRPRRSARRTRRCRGRRAASSGTATKLCTW